MILTISLHSAAARLGRQARMTTHFMWTLIESIGDLVLTDHGMGDSSFDSVFELLAFGNEARTQIGFGLQRQRCLMARR